MARVIDTVAELDRQFDDLENLIDGATRESLEHGLARTVPKIESVTPVQTGNARAGIGVPGPIAPSPTTIGGLEGRRDLTADKTAEGYEATLHLAGMAYFPELDARLDLSRPAVREMGDEADAAFSDAFERGD